MKQKIIFQPLDYDASLVAKYPVPSASKIPEWFKKSPIYSDGETSLKLTGYATNSTVKNCTPFLDAMVFGYSYVLNDDILVTWEDSSPKLNWRTTREIISLHDASQHPTVPVPVGYSSQVFKWENDIKITLPKGYSLFCTHPANRFDLPFLTMSGLVDSDRYPLAIKFPFFIRQGWEGVIESGTPVAQFIPIKRDAWTSEIKPYNRDQTYIENQNYFSKIKLSYKNQFWNKKYTQ